jgi:hypothetical protein
MGLKKKRKKDDDSFRVVAATAVAAPDCSLSLSSSRFLFYSSSSLHARSLSISLYNVSAQLAHSVSQSQQRDV